MARPDLTTLNFYRGVVYDDGPVGSDMLKIRILPDMENLSEDKLPNYPPFQSDYILKGVSEKEAGSPDKATIVWCLCTSDFKTGYIFGEANNQYSIDDEKVLNPWGFNDFKNHLLRCRLNTDKVEYQDLQVILSNSNQQSLYKGMGIPGEDLGQSMDVYDLKSGDRYFMMSSGTMVAFKRDTIFLRVGSPDNQPTEIILTPGKLTIVADQIDLWGRENTSLGKSGTQVAHLIGAPTGLDGSVLFGSSSFTI